MACGCDALPLEDALKIGSMFSGIDGLALAAQMVTCGRVIWHAEIDPEACSILHSHWPVVNVGDVTSIDWSQVERPDMIVGGFPCQDLSLAGKGKGIHGERSGLWKSLRDAVRVLRPSLLYVENVPALITRGLDVVAADLAEIGYCFEWACHSSASIGAAHRRERFFLLATPNEGGLIRPSAHPYGVRIRYVEQWLTSRWETGGVRNEGFAEPVDDGSAIKHAADSAGVGRTGEGFEQWQRSVDGALGAWDAADSAGTGREGSDEQRSEQRFVAGSSPDSAGERWQWQHEVTHETRRSEPEHAADGDGDGQQGQSSRYGTDGCLGVEPGDDVDGRSPGVLSDFVWGGNRAVGELDREEGAADRDPQDDADEDAEQEDDDALVRGADGQWLWLNPDFVEWMMGYPPEWTELASRRGRIRCLGNAVQPQTAAHALIQLWRRLDEAVNEER